MRERDARGRFVKVERRELPPPVLVSHRPPRRPLRFYVPAEAPLYLVACAVAILLGVLVAHVTS